MDEVTQVDPRRLSPVTAGETQLAASLEGIKDRLSRRLWVSYDVSISINHGHRPQLKRTRVESLEETEGWEPAAAAYVLDPREPRLGSVILCARASAPSPGCCCPLLVITGLGARLAEQGIGNQGTGFLASSWMLP